MTKSIIQYSFYTLCCLLLLAATYLIFNYLNPKALTNTNEIIEHLVDNSDEIYLSTRVERNNTVLLKCKTKYTLSVNVMPPDDFSPKHRLHFQLLLKGQALGVNLEVRSVNLKKTRDQNLLRKFITNTDIGLSDFCYFYRWD